MREDIISQKIRGELNNLPIDTEPRVMYLLVEIRKVFEHDENKKSLLYFYCNWVVHTKLNKRWAKKVLKEIMDSINDKHDLLSDVIHFRKVRQELSLFLKSNSLPDGIVKDEKHWIAFRNKLLDILIDTPIQEENNGNILNSFVFQNGTSGIEYAYLFETEKGSGGVIVD